MGVWSQAAKAMRRRGESPVIGALSSPRRCAVWLSRRRRRRRPGGNSSSAWRTSFLCATLEAVANHALTGGQRLTNEMKARCPPRPGEGPQPKL